MASDDLSWLATGDGLDPVLARVLERSRTLGLLGPGPVDAHVRHAAPVVTILDQVAEGSDPPARALDLGSGGGVPGLVLAVARPAWRWTLLDAQQKRADVLIAAVAELGAGDRLDVVRDRAEDAARRTELRASFDLVVSRSFGPPPVTAECAAGFLVAGGVLAVSEPPDPDPDRWPASGLNELGLVAEHSPAPGWVVFRMGGPPAEWVPRPNGRPAKRPLW